MPIADTSVTKKRILLDGNLASMPNPPNGCPFETRFPRKLGKVSQQSRPPVADVSDEHNIAGRIPLSELEKVESVIQIGEAAA